MSIIIKNKLGVEIKRFTSMEYLQWTFNERKTIYDMKNNKGCKLFCNCQFNQVGITISKRNDNIYLKNLPGNGEQHSINCEFHSNYTPNNEYEKGWKYDHDKGIIDANISRSIIYGHNNRKQTINPDVVINRKVSLTGEEGRSRVKVTLLGLLIKLNILSWDRFIATNKRTPYSVKESIKQAYGTSRTISIPGKSGKRTLNSCWFNQASLKNEEPMFVYMLLKEIKPTKSKNYFTIVLEYYIGESTKEITVSINVDILTESLDGINKNIDILNCEDGYIVGGFVKQTNNKFINFISMEIVPISSAGIWSESSYEKYIYNKLVNERRIFTKAITQVESYNYFLPDIIIKDRRRDYYGEIFGIKNISEYDERKNEKISFATQHQDNFDFWYWDVTLTDTPNEFLPSQLE